MIKLFKTKEIPIYLFAFSLVFFIYRLLSQNIEITLKPHITFLQLLYQMRFYFIQDIGYSETNNLFVIGRDCLGSKLFVCIFSIISILCLDRYNGFLKKIFMLLNFALLSLLLSYVITMIRIAASIPFCTMPDFKLIHTILSLVIYFGTALLIFAFLNRYKGGLNVE